MISRSRMLVLGIVVLMAAGMVGCGSRWLAGGKLHFDQKRYDQALGNFEKAVAETPNDGEAHLWLGRALAELDRDEDAVAEIEKAAELAPELSELIANTRGSYWSARYNSGVAFAKDANTAREEAADNLALGRTELAKEAGEQATEKLESAADRFERAIVFCPDSVKNYSNLGKVLFQLGRRDEGMVMFQKARELGRDRKELQHFLFLVFKSLGIEGIEAQTEEGYRTAIEMFSEAATFSNPPEEMAAIYFNTGVACVKLAEFVEEGEKPAVLRRGVDSYLMALGINPEDTAALENLAYVYADLGEMDKALETGKRFLGVEPWNPSFQRVMMHLYSAAGDQEKYTAHHMLSSSLQSGQPLPTDDLRRKVTGYGPGTNIVNTLRERGEPEQVYQYTSVSRGDYDIWFYWIEGRVYIFKDGREVFRGGFKALSAEKAREIMGG